MSAENLTVEQLRRMEENRKKALAKRAEKQREKTSGKILHVEQSVVENVVIGQNNKSHDGKELNSVPNLAKTLDLAKPSLTFGLPQKPELGHIGKNSKLGQRFTVTKPSTSAGASIMKAPFRIEQQQIIHSSIQQTVSSGHSVDAVSSTSQNINSITPKAMYGQVVTKGISKLLSRTRFTIEVGYSAALTEVFKSGSTGKYDPKLKQWDFSLSEYKNIMLKVQPLKPMVCIEPLPSVVIKLFRSRIEGSSLPSDSKLEQECDLSGINEKLVGALRPFQREGIVFGLKRQGRLIIADDMGLGKTIQAIGIAAHYRKEWPILIVVPSSVRFQWAEQFRLWMPDLDHQQINVIVSGKDSLTGGMVNILSYDIMARKRKELQAKNFQVVILDESHFLKNYKTARCTSALPLTKAAKRVILLSGTPALSRPAELYTQISAVEPRLFSSFHEFGLRYCNAKKNPWGWDYSGSSNMNELQLLLDENILIRRLKKDVLEQLPDKIRQLIVLDPESVKIDKVLRHGVKILEANKMKGAARHGFLLENYSYTASAKAKAVREYILDLLESDRKLLVFGHHQEMLDAVEDICRQKNYKLIRIDGNTKPEDRNVFCKRFQKEDDIRLAILSITAANVGLNLTAANLVVFAELYWNPGVLMQAEDRAHRIGQHDSVTVHYLVAHGTADDVIWKMIQDKLTVLGSAGLAKADFSEADTTCLKNTTQRDITSFFDKSSTVEDDDVIMAAMLDDDPFLDESTEEPTAKKMKL